MQSGSERKRGSMPAKATAPQKQNRPAKRVLDRAGPYGADGHCQGRFPGSLLTISGDRPHPRQVLTGFVRRRKGRSLHGNEDVVIDREALRITLRRFPFFLGAARRLGLVDEAFTPADQWVSAFIKPYQPAIVAEYHRVVAKERPLVSDKPELTDPFGAWLARQSDSCAQLDLLAEDDLPSA